MMDGAIPRLEQTTMTLNGSKITRRGPTTFIALPIEAQTPIAGGCQCPYCKAHPTTTPMWDTLAVDDEAPYAWTVHLPERNR